MPEQLANDHNSPEPVRQLVEYLQDGDWYYDVQLKQDLGLEGLWFASFRGARNSADTLIEQRELSRSNRLREQQESTENQQIN